MNVESELKSIINRLYDIQDVSGPDLSKKIYEIILQCREAIGYRKAELDRVQSSRKPIKSNYHDKEIYRQAFGSLLEDYAPEGDFPGGYRVLVDGNYETEFSANSREEAIQKFKDYFANKKKGINNSKKPIKSVYDVDTFGQVENAVNDLQNKLSSAGIKIEDVYDDYFEDVRCKVLSTENLNPMVIANMNNILQKYMESHPDIAIETEVNDYFYGRNIYVLLADEYYIDSSRKPIKSADKHFNYDEYLGDIYDSDKSNADFWSREDYNEMVETARGIFYPAVQKAANACHFTVSDNESEYVAEKCVRCFFDNASWDEAVNRPEEYYVNSSRKSIKSSLEDRLIPYLEEFEEGFADTQVVAPGDEMDIPSRQETFFEIFKNDYNLSDEDINKLKDAVMSIWEATAGN